MENESEQYLNLLRANKEVGYDIESNGLQWQICHVCGYGISDGESSFYVPVRHQGGDNITNIDAFEKEVSNIVANRTAPLIAHNAKFDMHFSENHGIKIKKIVDTMTIAALLDENKFSYSLKNVCKGYDIEQKKDTELYKHLGGLFDCKTDHSAMAHYHRLSGKDPVGVEYAKSDNKAVYQLYQKQKRDLCAQNLEMVAGIESELTYVLQKMERKGIKIDIEAANKLKTEIDELLVEAYSVIPLSENLEVINVKSSKDLQKYFEYLGINDWPVTDKGNPSFTKDYLGGKEEGEDILHARKLKHFKNSFLDPLSSYIFNDKIHTTFNQTIGEFGGARPGRLSSKGPNMQQIPKRDKFTGEKFRKIFIADHGHSFVEFDYSQAEPRLFAHYSGEPILIEGYNKTPFIDMHSIASQYMNIERGAAKNLNLGIMYVMGALKLSVKLGITYEDAKTIVARWHKTFKKASSFTKHAAKVAETRGYVKTILGRRARFTDPRFSYRAANRIVQGGSSDILKYKLIELNRWIETNNLDDKVQMILNIHDSILFQIRDDSFSYIKNIQDIMENVQIEPFSLKVPFVAEYQEIGKNWAETTYGK